jgi:hypothetical protein
MSDDEDIRARFERALSRLPDPEGPPVEDISRRSRGHALRRRLGTAIVAGGLAMAVGVPLVVISGIGRGGRLSGSVTTPTTSAAALPNVGSVVCDQSGTTVLTPAIRPQPDGVHFRIDNGTGQHLAFQVADQGARNAPPGAHALEDGAWIIQPGTIQVRCLDNHRDAGSPQGWVQMSIRDPEGLWVPDRVECTSASVGSIDYVRGAKGEQGDPVDIARRSMSGFLQQGDQVRLAGYPKAASPVVAIVRDGSVVATVELLSDGQGGWLVSPRTQCTGHPPPSP